MSVDDSFAQSIVHMYDDSSFSFVHHADGVIKYLGNGEIGFLQIPRKNAIRFCSNKKDDAELLRRAMKGKNGTVRGSLMKKLTTMVVWSKGVETEFPCLPC